MWTCKVRKYINKIKIALGSKECSAVSINLVYGNRVCVISLNSKLITSWYVQSFKVVEFVLGIFRKFSS